MNFDFFTFLLPIYLFTPKKRINHTLNNYKNIWKIFKKFSAFVLLDKTKQTNLEEQKIIFQTLTF